MRRCPAISFGPRAMDLLRSHCPHHASVRTWRVKGRRGRVVRALHLRCSQPNPLDRHHCSQMDFCCGTLSFQGPFGQRFSTGTSSTSGKSSLLGLCSTPNGRAIDSPLKRQSMNIALWALTATVGLTLAACHRNDGVALRSKGAVPSAGPPPTAATSADVIAFVNRQVGSEPAFGSAPAPTTNLGVTDTAPAKNIAFGTGDSVPADTYRAATACTRAATRLCNPAVDATLDQLRNKAAPTDRTPSLVPH